MFLLESGDLCGRYFFSIPLCNAYVTYNRYHILLGTFTLFLTKRSEGLMVCDHFGKDGCFTARQNNHIICRSTLQAEISLWLTVCISAFVAAKIGIGPSHPEGHCQYISYFPTLTKLFFFLLTTLR